MKVPCPCRVYIRDGKGSDFKGYFPQNKWALSCLYIALNNDIIPSVLQLLSESHYLHERRLRLHKCPSLPHLTPPPWKHLNRALSVSLFSLVSSVFFTESELVFIDIGTCSEPANTIRFYWESMATTCLSRANQRGRRHLANMEWVTLTHTDKLWVKCMSGLWGRPR